MKSSIETLYDQLTSKVGKNEIGAWHVISEDNVRTFGEITHNQQFIHTDARRAKKESPYGVLIAHAYLTLSLIPALTTSMNPLSTLPLVSLNYGFNRIRFPEATRMGARVRAHRTILSVEKKDKGVLLTQLVTVEQKGIRRPSVSAESLLFLVPSVARS